MAVTIKGFASDWSVPEPAKAALDAVNAAQVQDNNTATGAALAAKYAPISSVTRGSRTIVLGDSIDQAVIGWFPYYTVQSGKIPVIRNAGIGGETTTQMLARIQADVLDYAPDIVILGGSTNDQGQGFAEEITRGNIDTMVGMVLTSGATPILRTTPPVDVAGTGAWNTIEGRRQAVLRHNAWLRAYAASRGITVMDLYQAAVDPATGGYQAGLTTDGIHPTEAGYKAMADYLLAVGVPPVFTGGFPLARAVVDEGNMLKNGVFVGDTNADGVANNWVMALGGATSTKTLTAGGAGITGNWQRITSTDTATVAMVQDVQPVDNGRTVFEVGDVLEVVGRIATSTGPAALVRVTTTGGSGGTINPVQSTTMSLSRGVFSGRTTVPAGTTAIRVQIQISGATGWIEVAEVALRNLTKLGVA